MQVFEVRAHWDAEALVWWAESDDVPGLVAETKTSDEMRAELRQLVPELLAENEVLPHGGKFHVRFILDEIEELCVA